MGEPTEFDHRGANPQRVFTELPANQQIPDKEPVATTQHASGVLVDTLLHRAFTALRTEESSRPASERLDLYGRDDQYRTVLFHPVPMTQSAHEVSTRVAKMAPVWEQQDGKPDRPRAALKYLQTMWHRLQILRSNHDVSVQSADAYAQYLAGITGNITNLYGEYAYDKTAELEDRAVYDMHRDRLRAKTADMMQSGEYHTLNDGDWRYFNHSDEKVHSTRDRIYISAQATGDSAAVIGYWDQALKTAGIGHDLMYKVSVHPVRLDTIVAYPSADTDPDKLRQALKMFHATCPEDLLNADGVPTGTTLATGIAYGPEYADHSSVSRLIHDEKTSFGVEVTSLTQLAMKLAYTHMRERRAANGDTSVLRFKRSELVGETKRFLRDLLICAGINPQTMVPFDRGGQVPEWARPIK